MSPITYAAERFLANKFPLHSWCEHASLGTVQVIGYWETADFRVIRTQENEDIAMHVSALVSAISPFELLRAEGDV
jgi:hypothetical protein